MKSKDPKLQRSPQEFNENFDVIGLINCKGSHCQQAVIKNKYAIRYLAGQEKMCRLSGMAQRITPQLLQLRQRDQDMHRVLKVALQSWPTLAGMKSLIDSVFMTARDLLPSRQLHKTEWDTRECSLELTQLYAATLCPVAQA